MVPIKIECECGQHYAFDVEPANGRMPCAVSCPTCGADGTPAADESISQQLGAPIVPVITPVPQLISLPPSPAGRIAISLPTAAPPPISPIAPVAAPAASAEVAFAPSAQPMRLSPAQVTARPAPPPSTSRPDPRLGLVGREQAAHEARAKAMWGDTPQEITSYLMVQGYSLAEAQELTGQLVKERTSAVRANGIRKTIVGFGMMWVPVIAGIIFWSIHFMPVKLMGAAVLVGVYGAYLFLRGLLMAIAPKSEKGDVADQ